MAEISPPAYVAVRPSVLDLGLVWIGRTKYRQPRMLGTAVWLSSIRYFVMRVVDRRLGPETGRSRESGEVQAAVHYDRAGSEQCGFRGTRPLGHRVGKSRIRFLRCRENMLALP